MNTASGTDWRKHGMQACCSGLGPRSNSAGNLMHLFHASSVSAVHPLSRLRAHTCHSHSHSDLLSAHTGGHSHSWSGAALKQQVSVGQGLSKQTMAPQSEAKVTTSHGPSLPPATASLTRVFLVGQPSNIMRNLAGRKWRSAGPVSLLLFLAGLVLAILAAVRTVLVRKVRSCQCCKGFGIVRCRLCNGDGSVEWMGKNNHQETCPLCMTKRYVTCPECGGHYNRKMFSHIRVNNRGPVPDFLGAT